MDLPETLLRGIRVRKWLRDDGSVSHEAFMPDSRTLDQRRQEGWEPLGYDTSINWEDDAGAEPLTLKAANANNGAARLRFEALQLSNLREKILAWERRRLPDNPYHGNIIFLGEMPKHRQRAVAEWLALQSFAVAQNA